MSTKLRDITYKKAAFFNYIPCFKSK